VFDLDNLPHTASLLKHVKKDIHEPITAAKNYFKRLRPYQVDTSLDSGKREPSFGYPSGHSACGTIYGSVLAELFPEKKAAIMAIAYEIGWDRVILGKHYLTDVRAGRELGQAIVREMMANPEFQHDLAAAKKEVQKAEMAAQH
jgi:acid phosphatase (class A)